jgi:hypothetical protein
MYKKKNSGQGLLHIFNVTLIMFILKRKNAALGILNIRYISEIFLCLENELEEISE